MSGFIYAMRAGDFIKFGWAKDVDARRLQLQTGCPQKIEVVATAQWPREFEPAIHRKLQDHNTQGEWFVFGPEADEVVKMMKADDFSALTPMVVARQMSPRSFIQEFAKFFGMVLDANLTKEQTAVLYVLMAEARDDGTTDVPNWIIAEQLGIDRANVSKSIKALVKAGVLREPKSRRGSYMLNDPHTWAANREAQRQPS